MRRLRAWIKRQIGPSLTVTLRCVAKGYPLPRWGNLRRVRPFSEHFGCERGVPVDRYYLDRFLASHRHLITGRVLEIQAPAYTRLYGHAIAAADSIDICADNTPTFLCDLAQSDTVVPSAS